MHSPACALTLSVPSITLPSEATALGVMVVYCTWKLGGSHWGGTSTAFLFIYKAPPGSLSEYRTCLFSYRSMSRCTGSTVFLGGGLENHYVSTEIRGEKNVFSILFTHMLMFWTTEASDSFGQFCVGNLFCFLLKMRVTDKTSIHFFSLFLHLFMILSSPYRAKDHVHHCISCSWQGCLM